MPIINRIADLHDEITEWRHDLHANPELEYDVHRTAGVVAGKLRANYLFSKILYESKSCTNLSIE